MSDLLKPERIHWKHYFAGFGFITIILQLTTGLYLMFFFDPTLEGAYKSIQYISNQLFMGSLSRNLHRWIPALLFLAVFVHTVRCFLRWDFEKKNKRVLWLTGVLLLLPIFLFIVTGLIVPWEWKGYFFMEMIPNYFEPIPYIGQTLKDFFLVSFTIPRYYVFHVVLLPLISIVLIDYHILAKLRKRGIFRYLLKHSIISLPFIILLFVLAWKMTIPSNDPIDVPMPLEGAWVPAPEWYFLTVLLPYMYIRSGIWIPILSFFLPLALFFGVAFMPYYLKNTVIDEDDDEEGESKPKRQGHHSNALKRFWHNLNNTSLRRKIINGIIVSIITFVFISLITWGNYNSPTLGCNSCHHLANGARMGVPPPSFKDRASLPHLSENDWMMKHWYYPTEVW